MKYVIINYDAGNVFNGVSIFGPFPDENSAQVWINGHILSEHGGPLSEFTWARDDGDIQCYEGDGEKESLVFIITDLVAP